MNFKHFFISNDWCGLSFLLDILLTVTFDFTLRRSNEPSYRNRFGTKWRAIYARPPVKYIYFLYVYIYRIKLLALAYG